MSNNIGVGFKLHADATAFEAGMAKANASANQLKKGISSVGLSLQGVGAGIGVGLLIRGLANAVRNAQEIAAEAERTGSGIDRGTLALSRFGDQMDGLKAVAQKSFAAVAGYMEQVGLYWGGVYSKIVYGVNAAAEAERELAEAAMARVKAQTDAKVTAELTKLEQFRRDEAMRRADDETKINLLLQEQVTLINKQLAAGKETAEGVALQLEIERNRAEIAKADESLQKQITATKAEQAKIADEIAEAERIAKEEKGRQLALGQELYDVERARTQELKAQAAELEKQERRLSTMVHLAGMLRGRTGEQLNEASLPALQELLRQNQAQVAAQQSRLPAMNGVGALITQADIARLQVEIEAIKREVDFRTSLQRDFDRGGEALARRNFQGDPLLFDRVLQQLVADNRDAAQINSDNNRLLTDIRNQFRSGVPVMEMNK
jgi:hypothetical protein